MREALDRHKLAMIRAEIALERRAEPGGGDCPAYRTGHRCEEGREEIALVRRGRRRRAASYWQHASAKRNRPSRPPWRAHRRIALVAAAVAAPPGVGEWTRPGPRPAIATLHTAGNRVGDRADLCTVQEFGTCIGRCAGIRGGKMLEQKDFGPIYKRMLSHCLPYSHAGPWQALQVPDDVRCLPASPDDMIGALRQKFSDAQLLEAGVAAVMDESMAIQPAPVLCGEDKLIIALRKTRTSEPFELLTAGGILSGRMLPICASSRDERVSQYDSSNQA